jgi:hypothetical protein
MHVLCTLLQVANECRMCASFLTHPREKLALLSRLEGAMSRIAGSWHKAMREEEGTEKVAKNSVRMA